VGQHVLGRRLLLTGGAGFLGSRVRERPERAGAADVSERTIAWYRGRGPGAADPSARVAA